MLANGSMSSNTSGEGDIRKAIVEADLVDCMVALPGQLFYSTQIPVCLWFLARTKKNGRFRDRRGETLFIDARKSGTFRRVLPGTGTLTEMANGNPTAHHRPPALWPAPVFWHRNGPHRLRWDHCRGLDHLTRPNQSAMRPA